MYFSNLVLEDAFLSEPEIPTIVVVFIMLRSVHVQSEFCSYIAKRWCVFYSDLFITEGYKGDNQNFQIKRKSFFGDYKTSTSRIQKFRRFYGGRNIARSDWNSRA